MLSKQDRAMRTAYQQWAKVYREHHRLSGIKAVDSWNWEYHRVALDLAKKC